MTKTVTFTNNKGGVGKSTLSTNLAATFAKNNPEKKVLYIDLTFTKSISNILLGDAQETSMIGVINMMCAVKKRRESAIKMSLMTLPCLAAAVYYMPLAAACVTSIGYVGLMYMYIFRYVLHKVNPLTSAAKSSLSPNLHVLVGGETLAKASKDFPWETARKEWTVPETVDLVIFDIDNVLDDYAKFAFSISDSIVIPSSLNPHDFERLLVDPRNNSLFNFMRGIPKSQCPKIKGVIFNRVKCISSSDEDGSIGISQSDQDIQDMLQKKFCLQFPVETFTLMRELPPSVLGAMHTQAKPIPMLAVSNSMRVTLEGAKANLTFIANKLF